MKSIIERALELAAGGGCRTIADIERQLRKEGYENVSDHLAGQALRKQLRQALKAAKSG